jgi:hypothetical protein
MLQESCRHASEILQTCSRSPADILQESCRSALAVLQTCFRSLAVLESCRHAPRVLQTCSRSPEDILQDPTDMLQESYEKPIVSISPSSLISRYPSIKNVFSCFSSTLRFLAWKTPLVPENTICTNIKFTFANSY